jgi:hypothetical protein
MKAFTVTWHPEAEDELTRIWISHGHKKRVTLAVAAIDNKLGTNPEASGEPVREGLRGAHNHPAAGVVSCENR